MQMHLYSINCCIKSPPKVSIYPQMFTGFQDKPASGPLSTALYIFNFHCTLYLQNLNSNLTSILKSFNCYLD